MKISIKTHIALCAIISLVIITLVACGVHEDANTAYGTIPAANDDCVIFAAVNDECDIVATVNDECGIAAAANDECDIVVAVNDSAAQTNLASLRDNMFIGGGEWYSLGGDALMGWYYAFGGGFYSIHGYIIVYALESGAFSAWTQEFAGVSLYGTRDPREAHMVTLIEDFGLTMEDYIAALETEFNMSMEEIDALVVWARTVDIPTAPLEVALEASFWVHQRSLCDIEALFSGNVYKLQAAFPGTGVVRNGRAYTPEWIMHNIERAVIEEQIPFYEIERLFELTSIFTHLEEIMHAAYMTFQEVAAATR